VGRHLAPRRPPRACRIDRGPGGNPRRRLSGRPSTADEVAYHEAGHVVVGHGLGLKLVDVDIEADGEGGYGHTNFQRPAWFRRDPPLDERAKSFIESVATTFLAGTVAEARRAGFENWEAGGFDLDAVVREWLLLLIPPADVEDRLRSYGAIATALVNDPANWTAIEKLARALLLQRRLTAAQALAAAGLSE
jgi:hypothetical protein